MPPKQRKPPAAAATSQQPPAARSKTTIEILTLPAALLTLAALTSPTSQATLAPVFGSIPSSLNHAQAIAATPLIGFLWRFQFKRLPPGSALSYLAVWAFWIPIVSSFLFRYSEALGIVYGPMLIGFLSCHTIIIGTSYAAAEALEELHLDARLGAFTAPLLLAMVSVFHLTAFEKFFSTLLPGLQTVTGIFTPVKTQALIASSLAYLSHSKLALAGLPALFHTFAANPHFDSARTLDSLNTTLHQHNWSILARQWSTTGYISVLQNLDDEFRVMRADHSLLGGEWVATPHRREKEKWLVNEPIYAVFEMLEAVRLVPTEPPILDAEAHALVIGLGIGTAPKALLAHGINTTVMELDPAVHEYAMQYFDLPANHTPIIQDAVSAVKNQRLAVEEQDGAYDYILHDVFTGGAEPLALFTLSFLSDLRALLKPNGVVAINYAGDPKGALTQKVLRTISFTFGGRCRAFRDSDPSAQQEQGEDGEEDIMSTFANLVIFCRHPDASPLEEEEQKEITFRQPERRDYLNRRSAVHYLLPKPEHEVPLPAPPDAATLDGENGDGWAGLLVEEEVGMWGEQQVKSAIRHWEIMRRVLPGVVWEMW